MSGHVANKIGIGATRNLILRGAHPNLTEERIREDLDHIHNLVVISITFQEGDILIELNSIHNSLFARTCMTSRATYKGLRIDWYPDECAQPLPKPQFNFKKENRAPSPAKRATPAPNRFQMLVMDGTEDSSSEDDETTNAVLYGMNNMNVNSRSPWNNTRPIAA